MAKKTKNSIFPNQGPYVDGTGLESLISNPGQYYKERREDTTGEGLLNALQNSSEGFLKEVQDSLNPLDSDEQIAKKLQEQEDLIKAQEQQEKQAPKNVVEAQAKQELGVKYPKYKDEKNELEELEKKSYASLRHKSFEEFMSYAPDEKQANEGNWLQRTAKKAWRLGAGIGSTPLSFLEAALDKTKASNQFSSQEESRLEYLRDKVHTTEIPVMQKQKAELQKEYDTIKQKNDIRIKELEQQKENLSGQNYISATTAEDRKSYLENVANINQSIDRIRNTNANYEDALDKYDDAIAGGGFWSGLTRDLKSTLTLNYNNLNNQILTTKIVDKIKNNPNTKLTEDEQDLLNSAIVKDSVNSSGLTDSNYDLGDSVRQSLMFMGEMALTSKLTGGLSSTASRYLEGANSALKFGAGVAGELGSTALMGSTYLKAMDAVRGQVDAIENEDTGDKEFIASDAQRRARVKDLKNSDKIVDKLISDKEKEISDYVSENKESNANLENELENLYRKKSYIGANLESLTDENGNPLSKDIHAVDALVSGVSQNFAERFAERFIGEAADEVFSKLKNVAVSNKLGKFVGQSKVGQVSNWISNGYNRGRRTLDDALYKVPLAGNLTRELATHAGPAKIVHSLPSEMVEEIFTQLTPQYMQDYNDQLDELTHSDFYTQVALSTMAISGGTTVAGLGIHGAKYATNKEYRKEYEDQLATRKNIKDTIRRIDEASTDEQLAKDISMNTLGTIYDIKDYQARIAELRNKDAKDKQGKTQEERDALANQLEKTSFYNMAYQAIQTGTQKDLKRALLSASKKEGVSEETSQSLKSAMTKLDNLSDKYEAYREYLNFGEIMQNQINLDINNTTREDVERKMDNLRTNPKLYEDLERINEKNPDFESIDLENIDPQKSLNNQGLNNQLATYSEESSLLRDFITYSAMKSGLNKNNTELQNKLNYETDPSNAKEIRTRELNKVAEQVISNADSSNIDEIKNFLKTNNITDPKLINSLNEKVMEEEGVSDLEDEEELQKPPTTLNDFDIESATENIQRALEEEKDTRKLNKEKNRLDKKERKRKVNNQKISDNISPTTLDLFEDEESLPEDEKPGVKRRISTEEKKNSINLSSILDGTNNESSSTSDVTEDKLLDDGLYAPKLYDAEDSEQNNFIDTLSKEFNSMSKKGITPDFDGIVAGLRSAVGNTRKIEQNFNLIAIAFQKGFNTNLSMEDIQYVYETNFGNFSDAINELFNSQNPTVNNPSINQIVPSSVVEKNDSTLTDNNNLPAINPTDSTPVKVNVVPHTERLYRGVGLKLGGVLGTDYSVNENTGEKEDSSENINETAKPFIDWRNLRPGSQVEFVFNMDYLLDGTNILSTWENMDALNLDGKDRPIRLRTTVSEVLLEMFENDPKLNTWDKIIAAIEDYKETKSSDNPLFSNPEFLKRVPIGTVNNNLSDSFTEDGIPISNSEILMGGLNDYYWFNNSNVVLYSDKKGSPMLAERENRLEKNRLANLEARKSILLNGSHKTSVLSKSDKQDNKRLLKTQEEKENGYTSEFHSIVSQFDNTLETFNSTATVAVLIGKDFISNKKNNVNQIATINGVKLTSENIINYKEYLENAQNSGMSNGKTVFLHQEGVDSSGNPLYVARDVINIHESKQEEFKRARSNAYGLYEFLFGKDSDTETVKKFHKAFEKSFGYSIKNKDFFYKIADIYPKKNITGDVYRQDYDIKALSGKSKAIPNLQKYSSIDTFIEDLLQGNDVEMIDSKEYVYGNLHTNLIFTPITKNGETIYTNQSQPFAMFATSSVETTTGENLTTKNQKNKINTERLTLIKNNLEKAAENSTSKAESDKIKKDLDKINEQLGEVQAEQETVSSLPGIVKENESFINDMKEYLNTNEDKVALDYLANSLENFVDLHFDNILRDLELDNTITLDC